VTPDRQQFDEMGVPLVSRAAAKTIAWCCLAMVVLAVVVYLTV
jgi:hypothetical protein